MKPLLFAYDKVRFTCDVLKDDFYYDDLHLAWYDNGISESGEKKLFAVNFALISKGEGFNRTPKSIAFDGDKYTLSDIPLKSIFEERGGPMPYLSSLLLRDKLRNYNPDLNEGVEMESFQRILRRLTIWGFEEIKDCMHLANEYPEFSGYTEEQLLSRNVLLPFIKFLRQEGRI
jgi:hypothetical protein